MFKANIVSINAMNLAAQPTRQAYMPDRFGSKDFAGFKI